MSYMSELTIDQMNCVECNGTGRICGGCFAAEENCQCPHFSDGQECPACAARWKAAQKMDVEFDLAVDAKESNETETV